MDPQQQQIPPIQTEPQVASPPSPFQKLIRNWMVVAAVAVVLICAVGTTLIIRHHSSVANTGDTNLNHPEDHSFETVVTLTQNGFAPATATVKPQTEVFFDNASTNSEGEGAGPRRILQSKAAADQATYFTSDPITTKSEYGYTFRVPGTYRFYDADNPAATLTIIVQK